MPEGRTLDEGALVERTMVSQALALLGTPDDRTLVNSMTDDIEEKTGG